VRAHLSRWRAGTKGKRVAAATVAVALAAGGLSLGLLEASATLPGSTFEAHDGNQVVNTAGNTDWAALNAEQTANLSTGPDLLSGQTDNSFGNGTKTDDLDVTVGLGSIPNNKADLGNSYITSEDIGGDTYLYLGVTRVTTSGTVNLDIEVNQEAQPDLTTPGPKTLVREGNGIDDDIPDDVLIGYDFQGGSQRPTLTFRRWNSASETWSAPVAISADNGEAEVNRVPITNVLAVPPSPVNAPAFTFGEAAINLTGLGLIEEGDCSPFSSAYVKSRASSAFTSAVKDFIAPQDINLDNCGTLVIEKQTVPDGDTTEFDFEVDGAGIDDPDTVADEGDFSLVDGGTKTFSALTPGVFTAAEVDIPTGWALDSFVCDDEDSDVPSTPESINIESKETVTCTATNSLQVGSLLIHKSAKHAADALEGGEDGDDGVIDHAGVTFTIDQADDPDFEAIEVVTDADGNACVSGLLVSSIVGDYTVTETVPTNYVSEDAVQDYTVVVGTTCEPAPEEEPETQATALEFTNIPLTDVTVSVDSLVEGGTKTVVDCGDDEFTTDETGDGSITIEDLEPTAPDVTVTCTITIDP
jgi:Prealbumin-like fold domain